MNRITVLLVEDHPTVREGIKSILSNERDFEAVDEAETGCLDVTLAQWLRPAIIVMDIVMLGSPASKQYVEFAGGPGEVRKQVARALGMDCKTAKKQRPNNSCKPLKSTDKTVPFMSREIKTLQSANLNPEI